MPRLLQLLVLLFATTSFAYAQEWKWLISNEQDLVEGTVNFFGSSQFTDIHSWGDDDYIAAGFYERQKLKLGKDSLLNQGQTDAFITGIDKNQQFSWAINLGGAGNEVVSIVVDDAQNIYASLSFTSLSLNIQGRIIQNRGGTDICLIKFNPQRQVEWIRHTGMLGDEEALRPIIDIEGNLIWVYSVKSSGITEKVTVLKISIANEVLSDRTIEVSGLMVMGAHYQASEEIMHLYGMNALTQTLDDGTVIPSQGTQGTAFILSLNSDGTTANVYTDNRFEHIRSLSSYEQDLYFIGYKFEYDNNFFISMPDLVKLDNDFTEVWSIGLNSCPLPYGNFADVWANLTITNEGELYVSGSFGQEKLCIQDKELENFELADIQYNTLCAKFFISKIDNSGKVLDLQGFGNRLANIAKIESIGKRGELLVAGITQSDTFQLGNYQLINQLPTDTFRLGHSWYINNPGISFITALGGSISSNVSSQSMKQLLLHPNPSQDHFYLRSDAFTEKPVQIQIFSTDGKLLSQQNLLPNGNSLRVETSTLPPGMYVVGVIVDGQMAAERFVKY
jgi:hypothetical protein